MQILWIFFKYPMQNYNITQTILISIRKKNKIFYMRGVKYMLISLNSKLDWKIPDGIVFVSPVPVSEHRHSKYVSYALDVKSKDSINRAYSNCGVRDTLDLGMGGTNQFPIRTEPVMYYSTNDFVIAASIGATESKGYHLAVCKVRDTESNLEFEIPIELGSFQKLLCTPGFKLNETRIKLGKASGLTGAFISSEANNIVESKDEDGKVSEFKVGYEYTQGIYLGKIYIWTGLKTPRDDEFKLLDKPRVAYGFIRYCTYGTKSLNELKKTILEHAQTDNKIFSACSALSNTLRLTRGRYEEIGQVYTDISDKDLEDFWSTVISGYRQGLLTHNNRIGYRELIPLALSLTKEKPRLTEDELKQLKSKVPPYIKLDIDSWR